MSHNDKCSPHVSESFLHFDEKAFHKDFTNLPFFCWRGRQKNTHKSTKKPKDTQWSLTCSFHSWSETLPKVWPYWQWICFFRCFFLDFSWRQVQNLNGEFRRCPSIRVGGDSRELWCVSRWCRFFMNPRPVNQRFFLHKTGGGFWKESCGSFKIKMADKSSERTYAWFLLRC